MTSDCMIVVGMFSMTIGFYVSGLLAVMLALLFGGLSAVFIVMENRS